jgi:Zn-dependent protease
LGSIRGAAIIVQPSTLIMLVILAFIYSSSADGQVTPHAFSLGLLLAVLLFVSVFIHELAHAIAAWSFGRKVSTIVLTLWGGHTSFDARKMTPGVQGVTAIAGPIANGLFALASWAVVQTGVLTGTAQSVAGWLVLANVFLAIFNVLPGIPMDGGQVLAAIVWASTGDQLKGMRIAGWAGRVIAIGVVIVTVGLPLAQGEGLDLLNLAFAALLFSVIWPAASAAIRAVDRAERRESVSISGLMRGAIGVPYTASVGEARSLALAAGVMDVVVLSAEGVPAAIASVPTMDRVPESQRDAEGLQSVSVPLPRGAAVPATLDGEELVTALREWYGRTDSWAIVGDEGVVGVIRLEEVLAALQ